MKPTPLYAPAYVLATGACSGVLLCTAQTWIEYAVVALCVAATLILSRCRALPLALYLAACASVFAVALWLKPPDVETGHAGVYSVRIEETSCGELSQHGVASVYAVDGTPCSPFRVGYTFTDTEPELMAGDLCRFRATMHSAHRYSGIPGMAMEDMTSLAQRISARTVVYGEDVYVDGRSSDFCYLVASFQRRCADAVYSTDLPADVARTLVSACLGTSDAPAGLKEDFRNASLSHLLCVSGFHVGVVVSLLWFLLWPLRLWRLTSGCRYYLLFASVWLYAVLVGFMPSAIRAAVMVSVALYARSLERDALSVNNVCIALFIILLLNPYWLFSAGLQLSFAAVLGIVLLAGRLNPVSERRHRLHSLVACAVTPLAAMIVTAPVMLAWFSRVPLLSVPANAAVTLIFPAFMIVGIAVALLLMVFPSAVWLGVPVVYLHRAIVYLSKYWGEASDALTSASYFGTQSMVLMVAAIAALIVFGWTERRTVRISSALGVIVLISVTGCSADWRERMILIDDANGTTTAHIVVGRQATALILDGNNRQPRGHVGFLAMQGADCRTVDVKNATRGARIGARTIAVAGSEEDSVCQCDILVLGHSFKGSVEKCLCGDNRPDAVLLSAGMPTAIVAEYQAECARLNLRCVDLAEKAFCTSAEKR